MEVVHGERVRLHVLGRDEALVGDELLAECQGLVGQLSEGVYLGVPAPV